MTEEKSCTNCKHFLQHYVKRHLKYVKIFNGHCIRTKRKTLPLIACELWEDAAIKKIEEEKTIKHILQKMSERINDIAVYLEDGGN